jgi:GNAT superfamily N-acetyltransferase
MKEYPDVKRLVLNDDPDDSVMCGIMVEGQLGGFRKHKYIRVRIALKDGAPVGWAWVVNYRRPAWEDEYEKPRALAFMMFVSPGYRRAGIGLNFYHWATSISRRLHRSLHVFPWDRRSRDFYNKVDAKNKYRFVD